MAYVFDETSGATYAKLLEMVTANSFSSTRYDEFAQTFINDAVGDVCRRLRWHRNFAICAFDVNGLVTLPALGFFQLDEVWLADPSASGTGEVAFTDYASMKLDPLPFGSPADSQAIGGPVWYTARRKISATTRYPTLEITVLPCNATGKVAVSGLTRPTVMTATTDLSGLGAELDRAVIAYAKARLFELEDDMEMAQQWDRIYMETLTLNAQEPQRDGPKVTPGTWASGLVANGGR